MSTVGNAADADGLPPGDPALPTRCGVVAILGAPNAGKSTLVNALVGQKVAIVSPKAQTTRTRVLGIALDGNAQIILVDTPGIFTGTRRFDRAMVQAAWGGVQDAELVALVVDARAGGGAKLDALVDGLALRSEPRILILNKVDIANKDKLLVLAERLNTRLEFAATFMVSASTGDGLDTLKAAMTARLPAGPWLFPEDQVSDAPERLLAAEITREQLFRQLHAELPQSSAVVTEKYSERDDGSVEIHQQILVERASQRAIVLGKGGARLKAIGSAARSEIAELMEKRVHLYLHVKVSPDWDQDRGLYREIGLDWVE